MDAVKLLIFDVATGEIISNEEYKENQEKKKAGDSTSREFKVIDSRKVIVEKGKVTGFQRVTEDVIPPREKPISQAFPTSISDFMSIEPEKPRPKTEEPKEINDPDLFIKITERRHRLKELQAEVEAIDPYKIFKQILVESQIEKASHPDTPKNQIEPSNTMDEYNTALSQSVIKNTKPIARKHNFRFLPAQKVIAIALAAGLAFGSISIARSAVINTNWYQNIQNNMEMTSNIRAMEKHDAKFNDVTPNKITIPNQYDNYQNPMYWLDTDGVAQDILNEGDNNFTAALYYAYYEMEGIRTVGEYHNWDNVISSLSRAANKEKNPTAYNMTEGCHSFDSFLIKNGLLNEDGTPSPEIFEKLGKEALNAYSKSLAFADDTLNYGGRA